MQAIFKRQMQNEFLSHRGASISRLKMLANYYGFYNCLVEIKLYSLFENDEIKMVKNYSTWS